MMPSKSSVDTIPSSFRQFLSINMEENLQKLPRKFAETEWFYN
jgi:hypothetical protein